MPTVVQNQTADRVGLSGPITLLNQATTSTVSPWVALDGIRPWTITIRYASANPFIARVLVTNNPNPVQGDVSEPQLGADITAQVALAFDSPWKFVAISLSTLPGQPSDVSAYLLIG